MSSLPTISTLRAPRAQYIADRIRRTTLYDLNRARFVGLETEKAGRLDTHTTASYSTSSTLQSQSHLTPFRNRNVSGVFPRQI
jgi:hypothetical protein